MKHKELTIASFHKGFREKRFSAREVTEEYLARIKDRDKTIGAYLSVHEEEALHEADNADRALAASETLSPLAGVPLAIKDNIAIEGLPLTAGSRVLKTHTARYDAGVIKKLKSARAVFLGKTNLDEFAMGSSTENSAFQITRNPNDPTRVPGGSSGGSAAAVAAHLSVAALGSDTGGSIREPAAFCGVVGLKPTYGAVSRSGLIALASSLDQIGPITKTVEDAAILFNEIRGVDSFDATSTDADYHKLLDPPTREHVQSLTIGVPKEYWEHQLDENVSNALSETRKLFEDGGITIRAVSLPHTQYALSAYYLILPAEASANLARYDGMRYGSETHHATQEKALVKTYFDNRMKFGKEVKRRIILGTFVLSSGHYDAYYEKAQRVRTLIANDFSEAFEKVDVLLTPVTPTPAFKIGEKTADPLAMYLSDIFTIPANLAGVPAISIPTRKIQEKNGTASDLPIGFQLIGNHFQERDILSLGRYYEKAISTT